MQICWKNGESGNNQRGSTTSRHQERREEEEEDEEQHSSHSRTQMTSSRTRFPSPFPSFHIFTNCQQQKHHPRQHGSSHIQRNWPPNRRWRQPYATAHYFFQLPILLLLSTAISGQFNSQTYPDPRIDPFTCKLILPGQVCDPSEILTADERRLLNEKIVRLQQITMNIKNSSPACSDGMRNNLYIIVALIEKLGTLPFDARGDVVNIEKFTNQLRSKYQNYQDAAQCDPLVLIVNSRSDRQVFTVAGRDAKLSREVLQAAFHRNLGYFRTGNYALGLEGMVELIVSAYGSAHIVQTPPGDTALHATADGVLSSSASTPMHLPSVTSASISQFATVVQGVPSQRPEKLKRIDFESVPEGDRLWARILLKALTQCGDNPNRLMKYTRAIVEGCEDAMDISLKLISDQHYNKIEEDAQNVEKQPNARDKAWIELRPYLEDLYQKYYSSQLSPAHSIDQCPIQKGGLADEQRKERLLRIVRLT